MHFAQLSRDPVVYFARLTQETCCSCPRSVREVFATPSSNTTLRKVCLALPCGPPVGQNNTYQLVASLHPKLLRKRVCFIQSRNLHVLHVNVECINHRQRGLPLCCNHTAEDGRIRLQSEFVDLCEKVLCNQMPLLALKVWTCSNGRRQVVEVLRILKQMLSGWWCPRCPRVLAKAAKAVYNSNKSWVYGKIYRYLIRVQPKRESECIGRDDKTA